MVEEFSDWAEITEFGFLSKSCKNERAVEIRGCEYRAARACK